MQKMKLSKKTDRRVKLLHAIMSHMKSNNMFSDRVSRKRDTESVIQKNLFLALEDRLEEFLIEYGASEKRSKKLVAGFQWEQKLKTTVNNFVVFSTNHRPDAVLEVGNFRIGIEIKKGAGGAALRSGLGQCLVYSTQFDFVLYLFVDVTPNQDIRNSTGGKHEKELVEDLWNSHNVMFDII
jgi:hypothetical protein